MGHHHEDYLTYEYEEFRVCQDHTPFSHMTPEELIREFDFSDDPKVTVLVQALADKLHVEAAYEKLGHDYDNLWDNPPERELSDEERTIERLEEQVDDANLNARRYRDRAEIAQKERKRVEKRNELYRQQIDALKASVKELQAHLDLYTKPIKGLRKRKRPLHVEGKK